MKNFKTLVYQVCMTGFLISSISLADALDTAEKAKTVKRQLAKVVLEMDGVNGIGVTGCNPETGKKDIDGDFVHCISIMTETKGAAKALLKLYPVGTQIKGVYVTVEYVGPIGIQPRASGGN